jgi:hypothetical protein
MFQELASAMERGWGERDARVFTLLQQERAGVKIAVDREALKRAAANDH